MRPNCCCCCWYEWCFWTDSRLGEAPAAAAAGLWENLKQGEAGGGCGPEAAETEEAVRECWCREDEATERALEP